MANYIKKSNVQHVIQIKTFCLISSGMRERIILKIFNLALVAVTPPITVSWTLSENVLHEIFYIY